MKDIKNYLNKKVFSLKFLSKVIAVLGGLLAGFAIANWIGLIIGGVVGFYLEMLLTKTLKQSTSKNIN